MNQYQRPGRFSILPEVVKNLLIINGLFFVATWVMESSFGIRLIEWLGLYPLGSENFKPYQFATHMFMHGGLEHILLNMFALWMFGNALENVWGGKRFLTFYILTGLGAAAIHMAYTSWDLSQFQSAIDAFAANPNPADYRDLLNSHIPEQIIQGNQLYALPNAWDMSPGNPAFANRAVDTLNNFASLKANIPTVGASGAVFGVLMAFGMLFPNTRIYLYFAIPIKAKYFVLLYGALELFSGINANPTDNVAHFAHLGGMVIAYFLIKFWNKNSQHFY